MEVQNKGLFGQERILKQIYHQFINCKYQQEINQVKERNQTIKTNKEQ